MATDNTQDINAQQTFQQTTTPPRFATDFYQGGLPGVPGLVPVANQFFTNQLFGLSQGLTPFDYGSRIAGFTPSEQAGFGLTLDSLGSYQPSFQQAGNILGQSLGNLQRTGMQGEGMIGTAGQGLSQLTDQASNLYGRAPSVARSGALAGVGAIGQGITGSQAGLGAFDPSRATSFFNPFEDQVVQRTLQDLEEQGAKSDQLGRARAISQGAFGGSRARLGAEERERALREAQARSVAGIRSGGFDRAMTQAISTDEAARRRALSQAGLMGQFGGRLAGIGTNLAGVYGNVAGGLGGLGANFGRVMGGLGTDLANIGLRGGQVGSGIASNIADLGSRQYGLQGTDANRLLNIGRMQRGMDQSRLSEAYGDFVGKYNLPANILGQYAGIMGNIIPNLGTITQGYSQPDTSTGTTLSDLIGLGGAIQDFRSMG
jgi:hypothetical protein